MRAETWQMDSWWQRCATDISRYLHPHSHSPFENFSLSSEIGWWRRNQEPMSNCAQEEVEMHSYSTGLSTRTKVDNWQQLLRFFQRKGIAIPEHLAEETIRGTHGAASEILDLLYEQLTGKKLPERPQGDAGNERKLSGQDALTLNSAGDKGDTLSGRQGKGQAHSREPRSMGSTPQKQIPLKFGESRVEHAGSAAQARRHFAQQ